MDPVNILVGVAGIAWGGQIALGWLQIRRFNVAISTLANKGRVGIGRSAGRFTPRVIIALSFNDAGRITGNFVMQGVTVFSKPVVEAKLMGLRIDDMVPEVIFPGNKAARQALRLAISNKR